MTEMYTAKFCDHHECQKNCKECPVTDEILADMKAEYERRQGDGK